MANGDDEVDLSSLDTGDESSDMVDASTEAVRGLKAATDEMEKTRRALILTGMANQESQLPPAIPPQGSAAPSPTGAPGYEFGRGIGVLLPPGATPPDVAAPRNRTYIGPMTGAPGASPQAFFDARGTPNNTVESLAPVSPPMTHEQLLSSGYITEPTERLTPNNVAWTPAYEQWAAQQDLKAAIDRGVPPQTAMAQYPAAILGSGTRTGVFGQPREVDKVLRAGDTLYRNGVPIGSIPPKAPAPKLSPTDAKDYAANTARMAQIKKELDVLEGKSSQEITPEERKKMGNLVDEWLGLRDDQSSIVKKIQPSTTATTTTPKAAPKGRTIKDKSGKTWLYTGDAADPKTDRNKAHWVAQ